MIDLRKAAEELLKTLEDECVKRDDWVALALRQALAQKQECETCAAKRERLTEAGLLKSPLRGIDAIDTPSTCVDETGKREHEPVAWQVHPFDYGIGHEGAYALTTRPEQVDAWKRRGWDVQPLYPAPMSIKHENIDTKSAHVDSVNIETVELKHLRDVHDAQGSDGAWNSNQYMCGLFNGLELALSIFENREPVYKELTQPEQDYIKRLEDDFRKQLDELSQRNYELRHQPKNTALAQPEQEPVAWTLTEFLDKRETTTNAPLWFVDPVNSAWTPLYTTPPSKQQQAEKQEPYAYIYETNGAFGVHQSLRNESYNGRYPDKTIPVYTAPPKQEFVCSTGLCHYKPWLGLTDEEVHEAAIKCVKSGQSVNAAIRSIEAKLKELNHE